MTTLAHCGVCAFWQPVDDGEYGRCRRNPPRVSDAVLGAIIARAEGRAFVDHERAERATVYPVTFDTSWCGDFHRQAETDEGAPFA